MVGLAIRPASVAPRPSGALPYGMDTLGCAPGAAHRQGSSKLPRVTGAWFDRRTGGRRSQTGLLALTCMAPALAGKAIARYGRTRTG